MSLKLNSINQSDLKALQKSYSFSIAERILHCCGNKEGAAAIAVCSLTGIGGVILFVDHVYRRFASNSFDFLVDKFVDNKKALIALKNKFTPSSPDVKKADYEFRKALYEVAKRMFHHSMRIGADKAKHKEISNAASYLVQQRVQEKQFIDPRAIEDLQEEFRSICDHAFYGYEYEFEYEMYPHVE